MVGFVTYHGAPNLTDDDRPLIDELARRGFRSRPVIWSSANVDWSEFDALVLRSCWDYHLRPSDFRDWLGAREHDGTALWNSYDVVRWNLHKSYLRELGGKGVRIARTEFVKRGDARPLSTILRDNALEDAIVKPAISASATATWRTTAVGADEPRFAAQVAAGDVLVQEFIGDVTLAGEWSLIFVDGEYSHAGIKRPKVGDFRVQVEHGGSVEAATPPPFVRSECHAITTLIPGAWLFARIDGIQTASGFVLMEVECIEPHLFLEQAPEARARLADAIARRLRPRAPAGG